MATVTFETETLAEATWLSEPDVPVNVAVTVPAEAFAAAKNITFCVPPGVRVKLAGVADTSAGKPVTCNATWELNPSIAEIETDTGDPLFEKIVTVLGFTVSAKSGVDGGEGGVDWLPPPQPKPRQPHW